MTSPNASMVSSNAAQSSMKATHVQETLHNPWMPKARGMALTYLGSAGRLSWPDAAPRQSRSRENAGSAAAGWTGTTQIHLRQAVRVLG
jgi:hypothetical protein